MNGPGAAPSERVPTLTEVVAWPETSDALPVPAVVAEAQVVDVGSAARVPAAPAITEDQIVQRVLADLQRQVDLMVEYRLRETLAPVLSRAADTLVREARNELASTLRDVVTRAVAQELARHRTS